MKRIVPVYLVLFVSVSLYFISCKRNIPSKNSSSLISIPINFNNPKIANFCVDNSQQYLYLFIRDWDNGNTLINQIDISSLQTVKQVKIDHTVPIMAGNVVVTPSNTIITSFYNFTSGYQILTKFDANLNILVTVNIAKVPGGNFGRMRIKQNVPGVITGCQINAVDAPKYNKWFSRWVKMDENLNILTEKIDTGSADFYYGSSVIGGQAMIKTSDGGFIMSGFNVDTPYFVSEAITEKRDANLNLQWRKKFRTPGGADISSVNELNGRFYVYCQGIDTSTNQNKIYILIYDQNGALLENKMVTNGATVSKGNELMLLNSKGNFFMLAQTKLGASNNNNKGALFTTDANINVLNSKTYGGIGNVSSSGMIKLNTDRYLLFYLDNSFTPDGNNSRLVVTYIDADGNFLEY